MNKKSLAFICGFRALALYGALSFFWLSFIAMGISNPNTDISAFATRLLTDNLAIFGFSAVYGFSLLILKIERLTTTAKYSLHILVNYVASMACVYFLFQHASQSPKDWIIALLLATVIFFAIYGLVMLGISLVKKIFNRI